MDLVDQVGLLDDLLLTSVDTEFPDPLTERERAAVSAYLVLGHACIEEFLEDAFAEHFNRLAEWLSTPVVPRHAAALLFSIGLRLDETEVPYKRRNLKAAVALGSDRYTGGLVRANHGIKPANLKKLVAGVGLDWVIFDQDLSGELADLDTLGSKRGEAGHISPFSGKAVEVTEEVYPDTVREWVSNGRDAAIKIERHLKTRIQNDVGGAFAILGLQDE